MRIHVTALDLAAKMAGTAGCGSSILGIFKDDVYPRAGRDRAKNTNPMVPQTRCSGREEDAPEKSADPENESNHGVPEWHGRGPLAEAGIEQFQR